MLVLAESRELAESCGGPSVPPSMSVFQSKPGKININPSSSNGVSGVNSRHCADGAETPSGKDKNDSCRVTGIMRGEIDSARALARLVGKMSTTCTSQVIPPAPLLFRHLQMALSDTLNRNHQCYEAQVPLTEHCKEELMWWDTHMINWNGKSLLKKEVDLIIDSDASLIGWGSDASLIGWGGNMPDPEDRRSLVQSRGQDAYKLPRTASCNICGSHIPERKIQDVSPPQIGQYHGSGIHKQSGRDSFQGIGRFGKEPMDVVPGEEHPHHGPTPTRCPECNSRCRVSDYDRSVKLAIESSSVQQDCQAVWSNRDRPVCLSSDHSVPSLFQLAARSLCSSNRCISAGPVSGKGICQPTLEHDRSGSISDTAMVPTPSANVDCSTTPDQSQSGDAEQRSTAFHSSASHMEYLRERYRDKELSEEATSLMLKSWRTKTNRSYDSLFGKWHSWCRSRDSDPFSSPVSEVVNFLAYLYREGYQYRFLNSYRSAISSVHERIDGYSVGQHPLVTRLYGDRVFRNIILECSDHAVVASYSELYEEGEVEHINGPSLPTWV